MFVHQGVLKLDKKMWLLCVLQAKFHAANSFIFSQLLLDEYSLQFVCVYACLPMQYNMCIHSKVQINRQTLMDEFFQV